MPTPSVHIAVLVVATDPAKADLGTAMIVRGRAAGAGHQIVQQTVTKDAEANIRAALARWIDDANIDVVLMIGAVESNAVPAAMKPLITEKLPGFTDLFRYLAFQEMGAGAMLSNAEAAQCKNTFVFVLPGGVGAVGTAMDKLIIPQLDRNTQPKNLVAQMPRLKNAPDAEAVPAAIAPEKTEGGSGVSPKLPAMRSKAATGKNVIRRPNDDPPTKLIDTAKLERQLELSNKSVNDAQTKPSIDLRKLLPKVPPGADETVETAAAPEAEHTDVELLAAPPPLAGTSRIDSGRIETVGRMKGNAFSSAKEKEGTSPGTPPPTRTPAKPIPSLVGMKGSAFEAKEGTEPLAKPLTSPRSRPISVPPTTQFSGKSEGTSPGQPAPIARPANTPTNPMARPANTPTTPAARPAIAASKSGATPAFDPTNPSPTRPGSLPTPPARPAPPPAAKAAPIAAEPVKELARPISSGMMGVPSSKIFAAAAQEEAKTNGAHAPSSSVEMAPLIEATLEEEVDEVEDDDGDASEWIARAQAAAAEEAATVPRKREPTPPPPKVIEAPPVAVPVAAKEPPAKEPAREPPAKEPERKGLFADADRARKKPESTQKVDPLVDLAPPVRASGELPVGMFQYPEARKRSSPLKWLLFLLVLGAGFGAVVFVAPKFMKKDDGNNPAPQVAQTTPPSPPVPPPAPTGSAASTPPETTTPETSNATPDTPTDKATPDKATPDKTTPDKATPDKTTPAKTTPNKTTHGGTSTGPVTAPDKTTPDKAPVTTPDKTSTPDKTETTAPEAAPGCDEVACVISKYDRPCCDRFKPASSDITKRTGNTPDELDRAAVRAGMEKAKPAVVQCGEKASAKGTVKIAVTVAPEGNVTAADVAESPDQALGTCVAAAIKRVSFQRTVNGGSFTYPFVF